MTSSPHGPYGWATHVLQWCDSGQRDREVELISKAISVRLHSAIECMKLESLVIADQHAAVNTFPGLVTPPVTPWSGSTEGSAANRKEAANT